jgi:hypothetical protein
MAEIKNLALKAAQVQAPVLILGESGTGKELFAHAIHYASDRRIYPFVRLNCAAIPKDLLEAEPLMKPEPLRERQNPGSSWRTRDPSFLMKSPISLLICSPSCSASWKKRK